MKRLGTVLCLMVLMSVGGWLSAFKPPYRTRSEPTALTKILTQGSALYYKGDYSGALDLYRAGRRDAELRKETALAAKFLWGMGYAHFAQRHYQEAMGEFLAARDAFSAFGDLDSVSALNGSLSSVHWQLGDLDAAIASARLAITQVGATDAKGTRARLLLLLGGLLSQDGKMGEAQQFFGEGIEQASRFDDPDLLANAWDRLGSELLLRKQSEKAEAALLEAFRIRKLNHLPSLASSYRKIGLLRLDQGDLRSASALLDTSITESKSSAVRIPEWHFYHARGRLHLSNGETERAYADFKIAIELARNYRLLTPGADATRVSVGSRLKDVYSSFVDTGSGLYFKNRNGNLKLETFEALEEYRASSLAERLQERRQFRQKMPQAYFDTLAQLQAAETASLLAGAEEPRQEMRRLRAVVIEMESRAGGAGFSLRPNLLARLQDALGAETVFLSFQLGESASQLWVVTSSDISLHRLPPETELSKAAREFRDAVLHHDESSVRLGRALYLSIFGGLPARIENKSRWLLSLDEPLSELPWPALVATNDLDSPTFLVQRHSLQIVSSAANWLEAPKQRRMDGRFVGVGDAVYNLADARWRQSERGWNSWPWRGNTAPSASLGLSRLPGSGREIETCARQWQSGSILVRGLDVTKENVRRLAEGHPSVVHFATHVLQDPQRATNALIALSLSKSGDDQFLGPAEIGGWTAEPGLVVLSGCSSGVAAALPGAGLMGMTRAWLMAGAGAVVATKWPTPDDVGIFFRRFYQELQQSRHFDPAAALRAAQIEAIRSDGWRSQSAFWAAYFAVGNY